MMRRIPWKGGLRSAVALIAVFLLLPTLVVIPLSFTEGSLLRWPPRGFSLRWYETLLADPAWRDATLKSLEVALWTALAATAIGTTTALGLTRGRFRGRQLISSLSLSPIVVPTVITAIGTYFVFVRLGIVGTTAGLVLAHTVLALPLVIVSVTNSLRSFDRNLELAALSLGAGPVSTFFRITLPLVAPGVAASALFAFITSWDEIVVALFVTDPVVRTLPVVIFNQLRSGVDPTVAAAATLLVLVTVTALGVALAARRGLKT
ncbi:ABC transporter permease [Nonomuraea sp. NPDC048916]|uniref:ABC transporter permease n=1 Tax=Nonomuraea sp. NPDC048916 TaxID=3154232 RepID=UPI0033E1BFFC